MVVSLNLSFNAIVIIQINISHSSTQNYEKQKKLPVISQLLTLQIYIVMHVQVLTIHYLLVLRN